MIGAVEAGSRRHVQELDVAMAGRLHISSPTTTGSGMVNESVLRYSGFLWGE